MTKEYTYKHLRTEKIEMRVTFQDKKRIRDAANKSDKSITEWLLKIALDEANRINGADDI